MSIQNNDLLSVNINTDELSRESFTIFYAMNEATSHTNSSIGFRKKKVFSLRHDSNTKPSRNLDRIAHKYWIAKNQQKLFFCPLVPMLKTYL